MELSLFFIACLLVLCLSGLILVIRSGISLWFSAPLSWVRYEFGSKLCGAFADCRGILVGM